MLHEVTMNTVVNGAVIKRLASLLLFLAAAQSPLLAQRGNNEVKVIAEGAFSIPVSATWSDDFITGLGGYIKGYYGVGSSGQLTAMIGVSKFRNKASFENSKTNTHMIPLMLGYKQHIRSFYIEPQAGVGEMGGKIDWGAGDKSRPSVTTLYASLGAGFDIRRFELGLRYQYAKGIDQAEAGIWSNRSFEFLGLHIGCKIF